MQLEETKWFANQRIDGKLPAHLMNATNLTRYGERNYENGVAKTRWSRYLDKLRREKENAK